MQNVEAELGYIIKLGQEQSIESTTSRDIKMFATETRNTFMRGLKIPLANNDEINLRNTFPRAIEKVSEFISRKLKLVQATNQPAV